MAFARRTAASAADPVVAEDRAHRLARGGDRRGMQLLEDAQLGDAWLDDFVARLPSAAQKEGEARARDFKPG